MLCADFDGTLAAVVADPTAARPLPGAVDALAALARRFGAVWVVSGRPLAFLEPFAPPGVHLSGSYGLEAMQDGARTTHTDAARWRPVVEAAVARARQALPDAAIEPKGLSVTFHYRTDPTLAAAVQALAVELAAELGLARHDARMSVELRPPFQVDKGSVVEQAAAGATSACFLGDDRGDLPAFDALDRLAAAGVHAVRVGVRSAESPPELLARADLVVDGPEGAVALLATLA